MPILNEFLEAIAIQNVKDIEAFAELMDLPLDDRIAKGVTINNVKVVFQFREGPPNSWCPQLNFPEKYINQANLYCENNISKFREGEQVLLSNGQHKFRMDILEDTVDNFILIPNTYDAANCFLDASNYNQFNWEVNVINSDLTHKLLTATADNLVRDTVRLKKIEDLLSGNLSNTYSSYFQYTLLNDSQNEAVRKSIGAPNFHLIQGPPGTGKTETIAHIAKLFLDAGKRVFITAPTHTAINNCLNAIASKVLDASKVVKIGEKYQAKEVLKNPHLYRYPRLTWDKYLDIPTLSKSGIIVGGTPFCFCYPASRRLENWEFDIALIDESAQMSIPLAVSVMSKSDKFIFVGDHKQLEPIIPSGTGLSMFSESIFSRLVKLYPQEKTLLNTSYRLNESLIRIPNELFYDNQLKSHHSTKHNDDFLRSSNYSQVLNHEDAKVLYLHHEFDSQGRSPYEAQIVAALTKDLLNNGVTLENIGILTPYRAQVREIKKHLEKTLKGTEDLNLDALFIDTVDRMQGQERDYILYSMSNSHPLESKRRLDFFYSPNRLNVAITRAKKKCVVIANYKVFDIIDEELQDVPEFNSLKPSLDVFKKYFLISTKVREEKKEAKW